MNGVTAIVKKEFRSYFYSPLAYVMLGLFLFVMGFIFSAFVAIYDSVNRAQRFGQAQGITLDKLAASLFQNMAFILCFISPFITMRLFAEEKRQQTMELLLTAPIRVAELVIGKFSAALMFMGIMLIFSLLYVFFMVTWGNPDTHIILTTYIGLILSLSCYIALGGLISAASSSQAIAAIWSFIALLVLWLLQSVGQRITATTGPIEWGPVLVYLSPLGHFNSFAEGLVHVKDAVYFITFTAFALFLTHRVVESNRWR